MSPVSFYLSLAGLAVLLYRLKPWMRAPKLAASDGWTPMVSIIIPCRNEESNLPALLSSLIGLQYGTYEILVVDDSSTDRTVEVASGFANVRVITAPEKPEGWAGKNWACWIGASQAKGELFLFTDADTVHRPDSLTRAVAAFRRGRAELLTAPPRHLNREWWERLLGAFQLFSFIVTAYRQPPSQDRLFAIGQYLLVTSESYRALSGHATVAGSLVEDLDLAHLWQNQGCHYVVHPFADLYSVQMYGSFRDFCSGWRRLLRLGLSRSQIGSILEIATVLHLLTFGFGGGPFTLFFIGALVVWWAQRQVGRFEPVGALLAPISCLLFIALTLAAVFDRTVGRRIVWRDRAYSL